MLRNFVRGLLAAQGRGQKRARGRGIQPACELLSARIAPAITASFSAGTGALLVLGDSLDNSIVVSRDVEGNILVNSGAVTIKGGPATVTNTSLIQVLGRSGNDNLALDETNGALPKSHLLGGDGNDTLTGGSADDILDGQSGMDTIDGKGGVDIVRGGSGADVLNGSEGNDQIFGQDGNDSIFGDTGDDQLFGMSGDDHFVWDAGDGSDTIEGGAGTDTVQVNGSEEADIFAISPNGARTKFEGGDPVAFTLDIGSSEVLDVNGNGGDDRITAAAGVGMSLDLDGGTGNDTVTGGDGADTVTGGLGDDLLGGGAGADTLGGGAGNDTLTGNTGNDQVSGDAGDDLLVWNAGDGSDVFEGGEGNDTAEFHGAADVNDVFAFNANGARLKFEAGDPVDATGDIGTTETIRVRTGTGDDNVTMGDLTGVADVTTFDVDGGAGDDLVDASTQLSTLVALNAMGGEGSDVLFGSAGDDILDGNAGDDVIYGNAGDDLLTGGEGDDVMNGNAGDDLLNAGAGADVANGGAGADIINGDAGDDILGGDDGDDILDGGDGEDILDGGPGDDVGVNGELMFNIP